MSARPALGAPEWIADPPLEEFHLLQRREEVKIDSMSINRLPHWNSIFAQRKLERESNVLRQLFNSLINNVTRESTLITV